MPKRCQYPYYFQNYLSSLAWVSALEIRNRSVKVFKKGLIHNQIHQYLGTLPTLGLVTFSIKYIRRSYNTALNDHSQNRVNAFSCHPSFHQSKVSGRIYLSCTNVAKLQIRDILSLRLFSDAKLHIRLNNSEFNLNLYLLKITSMQTDKSVRGIWTPCYDDVGIVCCYLHLYSYI